MKINICGVAFDDLTLEEAVREAMREGGEACRVCTPNALMLQACRKIPAYADLLNSSSLILPDGQAVLRAAKKQGTPLRQRVAGIDFGERLLEESARRGYRVFLLGGKDGVAPQAAERLSQRYPGLRVCGCYWGYFEKDGEENRRVLGMLRACHPDILLVCMGFPTQERWIRENLPMLPTVKVAAGLGGSLDVWSGAKKRAPKSWQDHGMEWAWRMLHEPKRLKELPDLIRFAKR